MPIRGGGKQKKSQLDPSHAKRKGPKAVKLRQQKRRERKARPDTVTE